MDLSVLILVEENNTVVKDYHLQRITSIFKKLLIEGEILIATKENLLMQGFKLASGNYTITVDHKDPNIELIITELWQMRESGDIIIYSQKTKGISKLLSLIITKLINIPFHDISSDARLYKNSKYLLKNVLESDDQNKLTILVNFIAQGYRIFILHAESLNDKNEKISLKSALTDIKEALGYRKIRNAATASDYDHRAYDSIIPLQRYWQRKRSNIIEGYLEKYSGPLLDIGCGSSRIIQRHPDAIAFDFSINKLRFLLPTNQYRVRGSTFALPFKSASFKRVIHSQLLEHIPFDKVIFTELNRVMQPEGILVIGTPDYGRIWWPITEFFYGLLLPNAYADEHITHYNRKFLTELLEEHGFNVQDFQYICGGELIVKAIKAKNLT